MQMSSDCQGTRKRCSANRQRPPHQCSQTLKAPKSLQGLDTEVIAMGCLLHHFVERLNP